MLEAVKELHSKNYIHRYICPESFRVDNDKLYLVDFAYIQEYRDSNGKFLLSDVSSGAPQSLYFSSINCHNSLTSSLRDDIESLCYTILFLMCGTNSF